MTALWRPSEAFSATTMASTGHAWPRIGSNSAIVREDADERLRALGRYWLSMHPSTRELPGHQHFELLRIGELLPWIWMFEVHRPALRFRFRRLGSEYAFRYRLLGRAHAAATGRENEGLWVDEARPGLRAEPAYDRFTAAVEERAVGYYKGHPTYPVKPSYLGIERLVLPLATDGCTVDMLLGITVYSQESTQ